MKKFLKKQAIWFLDHAARDRLDSSAAHGALLPHHLVSAVSGLPPHPHAADPLLQRRLPHRDGPGHLPRPGGRLPGQPPPQPLESPGCCRWRPSRRCGPPPRAWWRSIKGLDQVYEVKETRNYFHLRFIAVAYVVALRGGAAPHRGPAGVRLHHLQLPAQPLPALLRHSAHQLQVPGRVFAAALLLYADVRVPAPAAGALPSTTWRGRPSAPGAGCCSPTSSPCL